MYTPSVNFDDLTLYIGICGTGQATASSTTLSDVAFGTIYNPRPGIAFEPSDVGMPIAIVGGGPVNALMPPINFVQGALFHTTIASYISPTEVTLTDAPDTSIYNSGFATIILYRPCPMVSDVATLPSNGLQFQYNSSIAPGTADTLQFSTFATLGGSLGTDNPYVDRFGAPLLGQPVYLKSSVTGDIFGGYIDSLTTSSLPGVEGQPFCWSALCASWTGLAKRRAVPPAQPQTFTGIDADIVFTTIVLDYLSNDGVDVSVPSGLPEITLACPVGGNVGQLLDQVVTLLSTADTAYYWTTDPWRVFILGTRTGTTAPWDVTDGSDLFAGDTPYSQSITVTHNQMANMSYAIGSAVLLNTLNATIVGNGTATTFNLPEAVGSTPTITLNSASQTVGVLGVDTGKNWYWAQGSAVLTQDSGGGVLTSADILVVTYTPETQAVAQSPNVGSLQSLQAIEGTSAEYDYSQTTSQPLLPADLLSLAEAYQVEYGEPAQTVSFYTLRPGLAVGQIQSITLAEAGISGSFLIATIQMTTIDNVIVWQYTAFGGANIGNAITALTQFINRQQATGSIVTPSTPITGATIPVPGTFASGPVDVGGIHGPLSFAGGVTKGNLLAVVVAGNNFNSTPTLTDTLGNTYVQAVSGHNAGFFPNWVWIMYCIANATGANAVTCTNGSGSMTICQISGVNALAPVDTIGTASGVAPIIAVSNANNVVVTGICMDSSSNIPVASAPEVVIGYTLGLGPASDGAGSVRTVTSAGAFASSLLTTAGDVIYASVSFNRVAPTAPPAQTTDVIANPQGTVSNASALTLNLPVFGAGGASIKPGTKTGNTEQVQCASGSAGATGAPLLYDASGNAVTGVTGQLVPSGGTTGQVLAKSSGSNYATSWQNSANNTHSEPLTDGNSNFIFANGDIVVVVGVPN